MSGRVVLVGAGPGDPDLLTVRAVRELERADVILYDALIPPILLALAGPAARLVDVGKRGDGTRGVAQDAIAARLIEEARAGHYVVRLKGGDPFMFGRGGEEASALADAGIDFEIVPGISSALAVPAYAGIPLTDRRASSSVAIVTGHRGRSPVDDRTDWEGLARSAETLVVLMGTAWLDDIVDRVLRGGRAPDTPAAVIQTGTRPEQRVVSAKLAEIPAAVRAARLVAPTILVIGEVARSRDRLAWYERRPLFGRRVLVLRSVEQRGRLLLELARAGAQACAVPLLEFHPTPHGEELRAAGAADYDWWVFSSANTVRFAAPALTGTAAQVACIGPASADAARAAGLSVDRVPEPPYTPERLVAALGGLEGLRVLLPRSAEAHETLPELLRSAGADVTAVEAYVNRLPAEAEPRLAEALRDGVDAALLTSPSTVERLAALLGPAGLRDLAASVTLVCVGPTTADALRAAGLEPARVADQASDRALVEALADHFSEDPDAVS